MTDLLIQDLKNVTSEGLAQMLSREKRAMFVEKRDPEIETVVHRLCLGSLADSLSQCKKIRCLWWSER